MPVPNTFAGATAAIPLSQLDQNFATPITLGNTAIQLGNTVTTLNNMTMANVTISSVSTPITVAQGGTGLVTITANAVVLGNGTGSVTSVSPGTTGNVLTSSGTTWVSQAPSGGTPGGSNTQVQFNNSGAFGGSSAFTWDGAQIQVNGITVGRGAGAISTNTAVGASALAANTTGGANVALGQQALLTNITGNDNTALGRRALYFTTASNNTAVGSEAAISTTTGAANTSVGAFALASNTTASNNTAVGYQAGYSNVTSANSAYLGYQAAYGATSQQNVVIGSQAGYGLTNNGGQVIIGYQAGFSNVGTGNTIVGYQAGYNSTGTQNTFVGPYNGTNSCAYSMTTGAKNTILGGYNGNQDGLDIRTASNYAVISDGDGNRLLSMYNGGTLALDGGAVPQSGTGITFPATQSASSNANTLDDYEEGTWTPVIDSQTAGTGRSTTVYSAVYTKIGNVVYFQCYVVLTTLGTGGSGIMEISGLPFSARGSNYFGSVSVGFAEGLNSALNSIGAYVESNSTRIRMTGSATDSISPLDTIAFATYAKANMQLVIAGTYVV